MAYEPVNWKNKGEDGAKPMNKDNLGHMDEGIEALDLNKIEISKLVAVTDTAPTEFNSGDKYYNTTDKCIYTATDDTNWGTTGEDPATNKLYVDLSESKLYYYDGIDFKSYGGGSGGGETLPVGTILPYTGGTLPSGYMLCDGSEISRKTYSKLFEIIGTSYGDGDGSTTFNLPNLKGKVPVGQDITDTDFDNLGKTGGEKEHKLTIDEMPSHTHDYMQGVSSQNVATGSYGIKNWWQTAETSQTGGGQPHNNMQPYQVVNYIIKVSQTTPTQSQVVDGYSTSTKDTYSCNYLNKNILTSFLTSQQTTSQSFEKINLDSKVSVGDKLTLSDNGIKIGAGITKVKVSAGISALWSSPVSNDFNLTITKNGTTDSEGIIRINGSKSSSNIGTSVILSERLIEVKENDVLYLALNSSITNSVVYAYRGATYMTVEVVE